MKTFYIVYVKKASRKYVIILHLICIHLHVNICFSINQNLMSNSSDLQDAETFYIFYVQKNKKISNCIVLKLHTLHIFTFVLVHK